MKHHRSHQHSHHVVRNPIMSSPAAASTIRSGGRALPQAKHYRAGASTSSTNDIRNKRYGHQVNVVVGLVGSSTSSSSSSSSSSSYSSSLSGSKRGSNSGIQPRHVVGSPMHHVAGSSTHRVSSTDAKSHRPNSGSNFNSSATASGYTFRSSPSASMSKHAAKPSPQERRSKPMRILAFGDSLTEGYYMKGMRFTPYTEFLPSLINGLTFNIPSSSSSSSSAVFQDDSIENCGKSGERVSDMSVRLDRRLSGKPVSGGNSGFAYGGISSNQWSARSLPHVVMILGGTNDISSEMSADEIVAVLHYMHVRCWERGCVTGAVTLPQMTNMGKVVNPRKINRINAQIRRLAIDNAERCFLVDLYVHTRQTEERNMDLWDDNIHFGPKGYKVFATIIAEAMRKWAEQNAS